MLLWVLNLDFAASGSAAPAAPAAEVGAMGTFLLIGAGCWLTPLLAVVLLGVH